MKRLSIIWAFLLPLVLVIACTAGPGAVTATPPAKTAPDSVRSAPVTQTRQAEWDNLVKAARVEGSVRIYSSLGAESRLELAKAFQDKFGLEMEFVTGKGAELTTKLETERAAGLYLADAAIFGGVLTNLKPKGFLTPIEPLVVLPEVKDTKVWYGGRIPFLDKEGQSVGFVAGYRLHVVRNTSLIAEKEVTSYQDLLKPELKGKILMVDPTMVGPTIEFLSLLATKIWDMERTKDFMRALVRQEVMLTKDARLYIEWIARGKYPLGIGAYREFLNEFKGLGAPVDFIKTKEGGDLAPGMGIVGLINKPAHPNAAALFANWFLSQDGQAAYVRGTKVPSARLDVSTVGIEGSLVPPPPGGAEKAHEVDEAFFMLWPKMVETSKEIFAPLLK